MRFAPHGSWLPVITYPVRLEILNLLEQSGVATAAELSAAAGVSTRSMRKHLDRLVAIGVVHEHRGESDGTTVGRPPSRFFLDGEAERRIAAMLRLLQRPLTPSPERSATPPQDR